ncbi:hepatic and glial cell adhesion molecule a [Maylandia zebra]|uniref:Ig-like domain-containing protein n=1 Tax=Astatotilapia calliptera TaxID=8154 RepID=A0A3P8QFN9_ASTCA|nr:hepatocyte cell adhesion molecule [Maylandia zebra]XP_026047973.1 hepatocyte cell adhesion molecule [Astatotilapia calliptera]XP_042074032.1 hepatic and glial cell adhesion molecule a [Haplochromis burtoni]
MKVERKPSSRDGSFADIPPLLKLLGLLVFVLSGEVSGVNVTSQTQVVRGTVGKEALLSVSYSSSSTDKPVVKWQLKKDKVKPITVVQSIGTDIIGNLRPEYRNRILVFENGSLLLHNLQLSDEGVYEVEISITDDTFTGERYIQLTVDVPISKPYIQMMASSVLEYSEHFNLHCSHDNGTKPVYSWLKGGKVLTNDSRLLLSHDQKVLTISRVLMSDDDIYACTVENPISNTKSSPVRLTVYRRSSLYIILSTGGIFLLITLVTVCACWKPSKKKHRPVPQRAPVYVEQSENGHDVDVVPKPSTLGRRSPMPLYVLNEDESLERLEECSGNAMSQSETSLPATYASVPPPSSHRTDRPIWSTPRRYPRSSSPLAQPLPQPLPGSSLRPVRSPAHSPGSSPRSFSPVRKVRPPVGIPTGHLPVEVECADTSDQTHTPPQH